MGLYRTKPEEVEAVQYKGGIKPFGNAQPDWVWSAMATGHVIMSEGRVFVRDGVEQEQLSEGDWLIMAADGDLHVSDNETFMERFLPARRVTKKDDASSGASV